MDYGRGPVDNGRDGNRSRYRPLMTSARTPVSREDSEALHALMTAFFAAVSFPAAGRPHYERALSLFVPGGLLVRGGPRAPEALPVEQFVARRRAALATGGLTSFEERELSADDDVFGAVGQRFSGYAKSGTRHGVAFATTGWISTQFVRLPSGWRICGMAWDDVPQ